MIRLNFLCIPALCLALAAAAAAAPAPGGGVLALVDGRTVTRADLEERIAALHRYAPMQPGADSGSVDIVEILDGLVDEELMLMEARGLGLDRTPEVRQGLEHFAATQAIVRLRREEVLARAAVDDARVEAFFAEHYSGNATRADAVLERMRPRIERSLRQEREEELSQAFVQALRDRATVEVDRELLERVSPGEAQPQDQGCLARVDRECVPLADFLADLERAARRRAAPPRMAVGHAESLPKDDAALKEQVLQALLTHVLVRQEALSRDYGEEPDFQALLAKRERELLLAAFKQQIVFPLAVPKEEDLHRYYREHEQDFHAGQEVRLGSMVFSEREHAERILAELRQGADFEFLAAQEAERAEAGGRWLPVASLDPRLRAALRGLEEGGCSGVLSQGSRYVIVKLKGQRGGALAPFERVREWIREHLTQQRYQEMLERYLAGLRARASIRVDRELLERVRQELWQPRNAPAETAGDGQTGPQHGPRGERP